MKTEEIKYKITEKGECQTPCVLWEGNSDWIPHVGSMVCVSHCPHFVKRDNKNNIVFCNYKKNTEEKK